MKKVLIITYYWPPSGGAGVQRWLKFAKYLPGYGVEPYILTVDQRYASYPQIDESLEKDIPGDLKVFRTKSFEALKVLSLVFGKDKVPYGGFTNVDRKSLLQTFLRFIRGNFFIPDGRCGWNRYALRKAAELIHHNEISTVITTGPPHSTHLTGLKLKSKLPVKWIADFRDPWTDIYYYPDLLHTSFASRIDRKLERKVLESADQVIANCNSNKELLIAKIGKQYAHKFNVITNGYDEQDFNKSVPSRKDFMITYSGTMSEHYRSGVFFSALSKLREMNPDIEFRFRIVGNISPSAERQIQEYGLNDIFDYPGYVNHSELAEFLISSSALLYIFPETINDKGIAGKLFEYLAAQRPVIAIGSRDSDASAIIKECDAGKSFSQDDEPALLEYLCQLTETFRRDGEVRAGNGGHLIYSRKKLTSGLAGLI